MDEGVHIVDFYDQAELVDNSIHTVVESLIEGEALDDLKAAISRLEDDADSSGAHLAGSTWASLG